MLNWIKLPLKRIFPPPEESIHKIDFSALKETLGYDFRNQELFIRALKHRSFLPITQEHRIHSNERLELLGDAVLGLVVIEFLYHRYPHKEEGELTNMKSLVVSRRILAKISRALKLGNFFLLSDAEEKSGGRNRASINSDALEAIIGAIYLDGGLESVRLFVEDKILCNFDDIIKDELHTNFKSMLLEYSQSQNLGTPCYHVHAVAGPDHERIFTIEVKIQDDVLGKGTANSKKRAEQYAAREALKSLYII
ncbi:MAG: ribonuclease III [bacterium]